MDLAAAHGIRPHTQRFPLNRASDALEELSNARPAGRVVLVMDE
jgi:D-arabinose 1-dehydrogenase-like Zn-dependent alcohol dehydrogenase